MIATYLTGLDPHPQSAFARIVEQKEDGVYIVRILSRCYDPPRIEEKKKTVADEDCKRMGQALIAREKLKFNIWLEHYRRWRYQGLPSPEIRTLRQLKDLWS